MLETEPRIGKCWGSARSRQGLAMLEARRAEGEADQLKSWGSEPEKHTKLATPRSIFEPLIYHTCQVLVPCSLTTRCLVLKYARTIRSTIKSLSGCSREVLSAWAGREAIASDTGSKVSDSDTSFACSLRLAVPSSSHLLLPVAHFNQQRLVCRVLA